MKKLFLLVPVFFINILSAQVGINTSNPQGVFNVDGGKNNATSGTPTATQQLDDFAITSTGRVGIGTTSPQNKLQVTSDTSDTSGVRLTNLKSSNTNRPRTIAVDTNGDVVKSVGVVGTVFIAKVLPNATIGTGNAYIPLQVLYDPENRYNSNTYQWQPPTPNGGDTSIYEVNITLHRMDGTNPFNQHRPNSATIVNLPTAGGQNFYYHYNAIVSPLSSNALLGANQGYGIQLNNNSGASYTFDSSAIFVSRGYWTIVIKRIYNGD